MTLVLLETTISYLNTDKSYSLWTKMQ